MSRHLKYLWKIIVLIVLFFTIYSPDLIYAVEPTAVIGQQYPEKHAFLSDDEILRVLYTHIEIVDIDSGEVIDQFADLPDRSQVFFSPDMMHLVILSESSNPRKTTVEIWNINQQEKVSGWEFENYFNDIAVFSPVAPLIAISSKKQIHLWNWETSEFVGTMRGERRPIEECYVTESSRTCYGPNNETFVFSPDGKYIIVASHRPDIELWNVETLQLETHLEGHEGNWVEGVAISPDGKYLASYDRSPNVYLWDFESRQLLWKENSAIGGIIGLTFSPDSQHLYVATRTIGVSNSGTNSLKGWDDTIRIWDVNNRTEIDMFGTHFKWLRSFTLSATAKTVLLFYFDGVLIWDIDNKEVRQTWADFFNIYFLRNLALSPDGKTVVSVTDHFAKVWDVETEQLQHLIPAEDSIFNGLAISPDSEKFAVANYQEVKLYDIQTDEVVSTFPRPNFFVEIIKFGNTGRWLAVSDDWERLAILDMDNPEEYQFIHEIAKTTPKLNYNNFGFSENDEYLAASGATIGNKDRQIWIELWKRDDDTFKLYHAWKSPGSGSTPTLTTAEDGSMIIAASGYETILWKITPNSITPLTIINGVGPVQFSLDGRYLFTNKDEALQIWDWQSNRQIKHASYPEYLDLSKDGSVLMTYGITGQYEIYDITDLIAKLPYPVETDGKMLVTLGKIKQNQLLQNFPNPFNPETWIPFRIAEQSRVTIHIYTQKGELVRSLSTGTIDAGNYTTRDKAIFWDGRNNKGEPVSSGIYLYTIKAGDFTATRKMLIRK